MKKLKTAVVGTGIFGRLHAQVYYEHPLTELCAVVNRTEKRGREVAEKFKVPWYSTAQELLEKEEFELVSICTSENLHMELGILFAKAGKKIFMEKPITRTLEEVDKLIDVIKEYNTFLTVNYLLRFDPRFLRIKTMLENNELGEQVSYFSRRRMPYSTAEHYSSWTDLIMTVIPHDIDLMLWFNDTKPVKVYAESVTKKCASLGVEDALFVIIKFDDGAIGCIESSWVLPSGPGENDTPEISFHLVGTEGGAFVEGSNNGLSIQSNKGYNYPDLVHWPIFPTGLSGDLLNSINDCIQSVIKKKDPSVPAWEARKSLKIVYAVKESLKTGKPVNLR